MNVFSAVVLRTLRDLRSVANETAAANDDDVELVPELIVVDAVFSNIPESTSLRGSEIDFPNIPESTSLRGSEIDFPLRFDRSPSNPDTSMSPGTILLPFCSHFAPILLPWACIRHRHLYMHHAMLSQMRQSLKDAVYS